MCTKFRVPLTGAPPDGQFPEIHPEDMNNTFILIEPGYVASLTSHFGDSPNVIVTSEAPVGWNTSQRQGLLVPDLMVAFDADVQGLHRSMGYSIEVQGKAPDFVLEVGSETTGRRDDTVKRAGYAAFGVIEYWRFDPSGGLFHRTHLAGDRLVEGEYQPIRIDRVDDEHFRGHSEALNLDLCWVSGDLRWFDPVAGSYLPTFSDERAARIAAEAQRDAAEARVRELEEQIRRGEDPGAS